MEMNFDPNGSDCKKNSIKASNKSTSITDFIYSCQILTNNLENIDVSTICTQLSNLYSFIQSQSNSIEEIAPILLNEKLLDHIFSFTFHEDTIVSTTSSNIISKLITDNALIKTKVFDLIMKNLQNTDSLKNESFYDIILTISTQQILDQNEINLISPIIFSFFKDNQAEYVLELVNNFVTTYSYPFEVIFEIYQILFSQESYMFSSYPVSYVLLANCINQFPDQFLDILKEEKFYILLNQQHTSNPLVTQSRLYFIQTMLSNHDIIPIIFENLNWVELFSSEPNSESMPIIETITKQLIDNDSNTIFSLIDSGLIHFVIYGISSDKNLATRISSAKCLLFLLKEIGNEAVSAAMRIGFVEAIVQILSYNPFIEGLRLLNIAISYSLSSRKIDAKRIIKIILNEDLVNTMDDYDLDEEMRHIWDTILSDIDKINDMKSK
ncbi:hypothetical protein TVAG_354920 [Trichomonas vaginalis G3]|uniref:Uncharacterized protein n=1 Tax=Trichomonas vaginalis (strain ATCC PRA-98 / G3) TaxID=412133 RepID=A2EFX7_TRIV3|nr:armadillo (ARM) repeat-containing protein family [Trichomonas vaginalis G3]EAY08433.1 hypothetical protein TVAG_354920 [Trichomonas vaginalis G3]KAI5518135.1 armadillo (ARM) repeat-containing protein family [Trichomonas vaginalis G3]|eukprot:XP_001320656.1 hypothetical protein [Trichomonas vaginalis G3]